MGGKEPIRFGHVKVDKAVHCRHPPARPQRGRDQPT
jgi:hypothetical protein